MFVDLTKNLGCISYAKFLSNKISFGLVSQVFDIKLICATQNKTSECFMFKSGTEEGVRIDTEKGLYLLKFYCANNKFIPSRDEKKLTFSECKALESGIPHSDSIIG